MKDNLKKKELGRGIEALIRNNLIKDESANNLFIKIEDIIPNKNNPREYFDNKSMKELEDSIYKHGILQPLTVRLIENGKYELISGGRRFKAIKNLATQYSDERFNKVPVFIKNITFESEMTELALIENIQRSNLNPIEEAFAFSKLKINFKMSDQEVADSVGKSRSTITNSIRLLNFLKNLNVGKIIIKALQDKTISAGHARPLLDLKPEVQKIIFDKTIKNKLSVRQVELEVNQYKKIKKLKPKLISKDNSIDEAIKKLEKKLNNKIKIKRNQKGRGQIVIQFDNLDDLNNTIKKIIN